MTTNERLWEVGLFDEFSEASGNKDFQKVKRILRAVYVDEPSIDWIIDHIKRLDLCALDFRESLSKLFC